MKKAIAPARDGPAFPAVGAVQAKGRRTLADVAGVAGQVAIDRHRDGAIR